MVALHHGGTEVPGPVTPTRYDDARELGDSYTGTRGRGFADSSNCARSDGQRKRLARLQARLAMAGWCLQRELYEAGAKCAFRVTRWGRAAELPDLAAVEAFAAKVGAPA